ncbi:HNH endonuclease [Phyllobacterium sp. K27]
MFQQSISDRMPAVFQIKSNQENAALFHETFLFENKYLPLVDSVRNDWIIYYRPARRAGESSSSTTGYFATARVIAIHSIVGNTGYSTAKLADFCEFPSVPFSITFPTGSTKFYFEQNMLESDGSLNKHASQQRVRLLSTDEYNRIMESAFNGHMDQKTSVAPTPPYSGFAEDPPELLLRNRFITSRALRDRTFSKAVGEAYEWRCAMTGIDLCAADGSHEVECAHIKPVKDSGPDSVRNGIPLLRTFHWLFDKGFISVESDYRIVKSCRYYHAKIDSLINASGRIMLPKDVMLHPHPDFLRYHREHVFKP